MYATRATPVDDEATAGHLLERLADSGAALLAEVVDAIADGSAVPTPQQGEPLRGTIVLDTMNYYPQRDGEIADLEDESTTTSELLAAHLPESAVVKVFNNIFSEHLATLAPGRVRAVSSMAVVEPSSSAAIRPSRSG